MEMFKFPKNMMIKPLKKCCLIYTAVDGSPTQYNNVRLYLQQR